MSNTLRRRPKLHGRAAIQLLATLICGSIAALSCQRKSDAAPRVPAVAIADSCLHTDSLIFSDVETDTETKDLSGLEIVLRPGSAGWSGSYREAAGEYGASIPLAQVLVDTITRDVTFAMPAGQDSSLFRGRILCDSLAGQFRAFRTSAYHAATFGRKRTPSQQTPERK